MRRALRCLVLACAVSAALATHAAAQQVQYVEIVVKDVDSGEDIGTVEPGGSVTISGTARVRLIMTAVYRNGRTVYPYTEYSVDDEGGLAIARSNPQNGACDLNLAQAGEDEAVYFSIDDERVPAELSEGTIWISVGGG